MIHQLIQIASREWIQNHSVIKEICKNNIYHHHISSFVKIDTVYLFRISKKRPRIDDYQIEGAAKKHTKQLRIIWITLWIKVKIYMTTSISMSFRLIHTSITYDMYVLRYFTVHYMYTWLEYVHRFLGFICYAVVYIQG